MTYHGQVKNGLVVFDEPLELADGTPVRVEVLSDVPESNTETIPTLAERLAPFTEVSPLSCGSGSGHVQSGGGYSEGFEEFGVFVHFFSQ